VVENHFSATEEERKQDGSRSNEPTDLAFIKSNSRYPTAVCGCLGNGVMPTGRKSAVFY